jgi:hypothetical protein
MPTISLPDSGKDKEYLAARQQSAKYFTPTTRTTSEAAGESSSTAENVTEEVRRSRERARLLGSATKLRKQVLGSIAERTESVLGIRESCALEFLHECNNLL